MPNKSFVFIYLICNVFLILVVNVNRLQHVLIFKFAILHRKKKHNFALDWTKCKKNTKFYTKESVQYNGFFNVLSLVWNLVYHMYSDLPFSYIDFEYLQYYCCKTKYMLKLLIFITLKCLFWSRNGNILRILKVFKFLKLYALLLNIKVI